jgi:hypothetical protein
MLPQIMQITINYRGDGGKTAAENGTGNLSEGAVLRDFRPCPESNNPFQSI